ncbi:hypothetical protein DZC41_07180 [Acinetobacter haemolyticus]|nr:hypothetical protein BSR56_04140 [Acinetobacter haemolyticus]NCU23253.1 hypothetical protein [Acinetobacter haemolyticus]RSN78162.1 hypothetical protein EA769_02410 [Acinetobacter haemolyticus]
MSLSRRVMAKTAVNFVMKFDKGSTIVCISCLVYVVLANNAGMAEIIIIPPKTGKRIRVSCGVLVWK